MIARISLGFAACAVLALSSNCIAQSTGNINGSVSLTPSGQPMHGIRLILSPLGKSVDSGEDGTYEFRDVVPGTYEVIARSPGLADERKKVQLTAGATVTADFELKLASVHENVTVTATGREQSTLELVQSVAEIDQTQLTLRSASSLGEVLQNETGVAKRSFGPGSARPVVRG